MQHSGYRPVNLEIEWLTEGKVLQWRAKVYKADKCSLLTSLGFKKSDRCWDKVTLWQEISKRAHSYMKRVAGK